MPGELDLYAQYLAATTGGPAMTDGVPSHSSDARTDDFVSSDRAADRHGARTTDDRGCVRISPETHGRDL